MSEDEYFNKLYELVKNSTEIDKEDLQEYLEKMEMKFNENTTFKEYENHIKKHNSKILYKIFKTRNKNILAHICRYILELEWHNEWAIAVAGKHTKTIFGWFD